MHQKTEALTQSLFLSLVLVIHSLTFLAYFNVAVP